MRRELDMLPPDMERLFYDKHKHRFTLVWTDGQVSHLDFLASIASMFGFDSKHNEKIADAVLSIPEKDWIKMFEDYMIVANDTPEAREWALGLDMLRPFHDEDR